MGQFEDYKDAVLKQYQKGNIVVIGAEEEEVYDLKQFIKQPIEGILYDLNRGEEVILTFIKERKWVNDFASTKVIRALKEENELLKKKIEDLTK